jgi:hypothetical protein
MIHCSTNPKSGRIQVKHYPSLKNISKTATFDVSEELPITGVDYSRDARRMQSEGRLFLAECSGVCLSCENPFSVFRIIQTSGPVPAHLSAADFENGYRCASIYKTGRRGLANTHLLEDVMHHGNFYGYWLESWSEAVHLRASDEVSMSSLIDASLLASKAISGLYRESHRTDRAEARIN